MSSPSNGPYKSRIFNFINRQYLYLNDKLGKTLRQVKVATEWGVQIVLYPVYLLVQTARLLERQVETRIEKAKLLKSNSQIPSELSTTILDEPLEKVLETVEPWLYFSPLETILQSDIDNYQAIIPIESVSKAIILESESVSLTNYSENSELPVEKKKFLVRGIASLLDNHKLVLVNDENEIIDILTQEQQQKLQQRLTWEIANYSQIYRLFVANKEGIAHLPRIKSNNPNLLPPVRGFWQIMEWMQNSTLAIALNIFGESSVILYDERLPLDENNLQELPGILVKIDKTIAAIEVQTIGSLSLQSDNDRELTIDDNRQIIDTEPDPFQIQALIKAAIDYFFAEKQSSSKIKSNDAIANLPEANDDPWLTWGDLFSETETQPTVNQPLKTVSLPTSPPRPQLPSAAKKQPSSKKKKKSPLVKTPTQEIVVTEKSEPYASSSGEITKIESVEDWLEIESTHTGYVKHPLEIILQWLDRIMVWLEDVLVTVLIWLRRKFFK